MNDPLTLNSGVKNLPNPHLLLTRRRQLLLGHDPVFIFPHHGQYRLDQTRSSVAGAWVYPIDINWPTDMSSRYMTKLEVRGEDNALPEKTAAAAGNISISSTVGTDVMNSSMWTLLIPSGTITWPSAKRSRVQCHRTDDGISDG